MCILYYRETTTELFQQLSNFLNSWNFVCQYIQTSKYPNLTESFFLCVKDTVIPCTFTIKPRYSIIFIGVNISLLSFTTKPSESSI